jgi:uncharacterized protein
MIGTLSPLEIEDLLQTAPVCRLGCSYDGKIYVVPINYLYEGGILYGHSREGMKIEMMRKNARVCIEIDEITDLSNWKSVILWGDYEEIMKEEEKYDIMQKMVDKTMHLKLTETAVPPHAATFRDHPQPGGGKALVVFRIHIKEKTGRFEKQ